jgi:polysaccharide deacetylase 2 family uncharacterized protein YibQ
MRPTDAFLTRAPHRPRRILVYIGALISVVALLMSTRNAVSRIVEDWTSARVDSLATDASVPEPPELPAAALAPAEPSEAAASSAAPASVTFSTAPTIAIVFDDLGYSTRGLAGELLDIPATLTFGVIPGLRNSVAFAESALARGHDVILHLPLEPLDLEKHDPGESALLTTLDPDENLRRLRMQLDALPFFLGISNHMGSRFSADREAMRLILTEIRRHDPTLFFLDSRTTPHTVIPEMARSTGVQCLSNDLFLEGVGFGTRGSAIQTERLAAIARKRGQAIGIGHVGPNTVAAVQEAVTRWQREGIRLVGLSDLMHRDRDGSSLVRLEQGEENDATGSQRRPRGHSAGGQEGTPAGSNLGRPSL